VVVKVNRRSVQWWTLNTRSSLNALIGIRDGCGRKNAHGRGAR
jgi:hypothetical protein